MRMVLPVRREEAAEDDILRMRDRGALGLDLVRSRRVRGRGLKRGGMGFRWKGEGGEKMGRGIGEGGGCVEKSE